MKARSIALVVLAALTMGSIAVGQRPPKPATDPTVYVTDSGKKYHQKICKLKKGSRGMMLSVAKKKGFKPCTVCKPAQ